MMPAVTLGGVCFFFLFLLVSSLDTDSDTELEFLSEPSSRLVKPGDGRAIFRCNVSPPSADVLWLWKGQPVTHNRWVKVSKHKLTVHLGKMDKNAKFPHSRENGYFQCEAKLRGKALVSAPAELIIAVLEPFSIQSDVYITAKRGNTAVIPCNPPYSVPTVVTEFSFNNTVIDRSTDRQKLMVSGNLQIFNVQASDSGEYICVANNPYLSEKRQANHKVFLHVTEPAKSEAPRFIVAPRPRTPVVLGSNISLECVVSGFPVPSIAWRRHHGHLPNSRHQQVAGNLLLFGIRRGDEGTYYCEAENSVGDQISTSTIIEVQETPQIIKSPKDWLVDAGQNITLDCVTRGHPRPVITWLQNGRTVAFEPAGKTKESHIVLENVSPKHSGFYQCFASNELGTVYATSVVSVFTGNQSVDADYENEEYEDDYDVDEGVDSATFHPKKKNPSLSNGHHPNHDENSPDDGESISDMDLDSVSKKQRKKKKSKGVKLVPPSRPEVTRLSDNSVMVRWGVPRNDGLPILFFKVQYREVGRRSTQWMTIDEDIAAHIHSYAVTELRTGGKYRFRIAAVYSNNDNKLGPNSAKFVLYKDPPTKKPIVGPLITHAEAASPSAITLHWEYTDIDSIPIEGFFIYYRSSHSAGDYLKVTVLGANTRSHIISHLLPDTGYDIKTQCFNTAGTSEFSNIYTCKTKPSEGVGIRSRNSKSQHSEDDVQSFSITEPVSSKNSDGNLILYIVVGVICGVLLIAISVFIALYFRQRQNRHNHSNRSSVLESSPKTGNGHIATNGYVPVADKINISVNPLAHLDSDDSDKPDQYEDMVSNNNEIIRLQTFSTNEEQHHQPLLEEEEATTSTRGADEEAETVILESVPGTNAEVPRSI